MNYYERKEQTKKIIEHAIKEKISYKELVKQITLTTGIGTDVIDKILLAYDVDLDKYKGA